MIVESGCQNVSASSVYPSKAVSCVYLLEGGEGGRILGGYTVIVNR